MQMAKQQTSNGKPNLERNSEKVGHSRDETCKRKLMLLRTHIQH